MHPWPRDRDILRADCCVPTAVPSASKSTSCSHSWH
ncbi:rCG44449, isoform CRA_a [Rattus norvegicus]|uniref:RCG44449, isoform CRA_a n=1 Tax=Rattus norvegicus TaxID=10116 RepID=A6I502_RAT|nr:rCG44449, isoform CRA_a [Rattus norvegicus]EDM10110.1 rCG44449, isoform CRA_a [Rattus norvegicus]